MVFPTMQQKQSPASWSSTFWVDFCFIFFIFFLYAGSAVPAINEPHYWTKAAHFWNPYFGKGDLFLESGDAHWLFFATFGLLTQYLPMTWAVWIGRFVTWIFLALGWTMLGRSIWNESDGSPILESGRGDAARLQNGRHKLGPTMAGCWGLAWLAGMHYGHWAGEWVIGGCESKGIAYAMIFAGLACAVQKRWTLAWALLGGAAAFHVVTGIWVILCVLTVSLWNDWGRSSRESKSESQTLGQWMSVHWIGWLLCLVGVTVGVVPAAAIDWGTDPVLASESAVKQVYTRLGHHLAPTRFNWIRWRDFGVQFACGCVALWMLTRSRWVSENAFSGPETYTTEDPVSSHRELPRGLRLVVGWGLFGLAVAAVGLTIDLAFGRAFPTFASKILRFYLFRWNDVSFPMMVGAILVSFAYGRLQWVQHRKSETQGAAKVNVMDATVRWGAWAYVMVPGIILLMYRIDANYHESIPAGDKAHFVAKGDSEEDQAKQFEDWLRVCEWISKNSDRESLWLTPRRQQSFKWHTGRPELACWKDSPQNAEALVEWSKRLADAYQFDKEKILQPWTTDKLWELHNKYGIRYVLLDRRVAKQTPPLLPLLYPSQNELNDTFAVFEIPSQKVNVSK